MANPSDNQTPGPNKITWICTVCGFLFTGEKPPKGCPHCHSPSGEFIPVHDKPVTCPVEDFDVLLINGSSHRAGNTGMMTDIAEEMLTEKNISYKRFNLNEFIIEQ